MARMTFHQKSRYHLNKLFNLRRADANLKERHTELRLWLASVAYMMEEDELVSILMHIYSSELRTDGMILEALSNSNITNLESTSKELTFKD